MLGCTLFLLGPLLIISFLLLANSTGNGNAVKPQYNEHSYNKIRDVTELISNS